MEYGESHVMGRMGFTFPVGFVCDKGPSTTAMLREKISICSVESLDSLL
jgi:hypothetical protein